MLSSLTSSLSLSTSTSSRLFSTVVGKSTPRKWPQPFAHSMNFLGQPNRTHVIPSDPTDLPTLYHSLLKKRQANKASALRQSELRTLLILLGKREANASKNNGELGLPIGDIAGSPHAFIRNMLTLYPIPVQTAAEDENKKGLRITTLSQISASTVVNTHLLAVSDPLLTVQTFFHLTADREVTIDDKKKVKKGTFYLLQKNLKKKRDLVLTGKVTKQSKVHMTMNKRNNIDPHSSETTPTKVVYDKKFYYFPLQIGDGVALRVGSTSVRKVIESLLKLPSSAENTQKTHDAFVDIVRGMSARYVLENEGQTVSGQPLNQYLRDRTLPISTSPTQTSAPEPDQTKIANIKNTAGLNRRCVRLILTALMSDEMASVKPVDVHGTDNIDFTCLVPKSRLRTHFNGLNDAVGKDAKVTRRAVLAEEGKVVPGVLDESAIELVGEGGKGTAGWVLEVLEKRGMGWCVFMEDKDLDMIGKKGEESEGESESEVDSETEAETEATEEGEKEK